MRKKTLSLSLITTELSRIKERVSQNRNSQDRDCRTTAEKDIFSSQPRAQSPSPDKSAEGSAKKEGVKRASKDDEMDIDHEDLFTHETVQDDWSFASKLESEAKMASTAVAL